MAANLAEGWRKRRYAAAFVSKLNDSEGEAAETQTWLQFAVECGYLPADTTRSLYAEYDEIIAMLVQTPKLQKTMPFTPTIPAAGSPLDSSEIRSQFVALFDLIQSIPAGPTGPEGPPGTPGQPFAQAVVDGTTTLGPGNAAAVQVFFDGINVHFQFQIPQGNPGEVTQAQLDNSVQGVLNSSSNNTNSVPTLDPAMPVDLTILRDKMNELILALRR